MTNIILTEVMDRNVILHVVFLTVVLCTNVLCFTMNSATVDVNQEHFNDDVIMSLFVSTLGSDNLDCGQKQHPCKSLKFALQNVGNATSVFIYIFSGVYSFESVKMDCSVGTMKNVVINGLWKSVHVGLSADIVKCSVTFNNLQWSNTTNPVLINSIISTVTIINSTVSHIGFSLLSSGSSISLVNTVLTNCTGWQPLFPLITTSGVTSFHNKVQLQNTTFSYNKSPLMSIKAAPFSIQKCHFISNTVQEQEVLLLISGAEGTVSESLWAKNNGNVVKISEESIVNMTRIMFNGNDVLYGSLVHIGQGSSLRASMCSFVKSYGISPGPVIKIDQGAKNVNFTNCNFSCNQVNGSTSVSPVENRGKQVITCSNCSTDPRCPVFCKSGEYLVSSIMCLSCPKGTYSPGSRFNITTFACKKCEPGFYSSSEGSSSCIPCKAGSFAAKSGSTMCRVCKNNFMSSNKGQASCSKLTTSFIVLTVCVTLLIVVPLVVLLVQYLQTKNVMCTSKRKMLFHRLYENGNVAVQ